MLTPKYRDADNRIELYACEIAVFAYWVVQNKLKIKLVSNQSV